MFQAPIENNTCLNKEPSPHTFTSINLEQGAFYKHQPSFTSPTVRTVIQDPGKVDSDLQEQLTSLKKIQQGSAFAFHSLVSVNFPSPVIKPGLIFLTWSCYSSQKAPPPLSCLYVFSFILITSQEGRGTDKMRIPSCEDS